MRALVVDHDEIERDALAEKLRAEYFAVDATSDGMEGSYLARTNDYDIIVLDSVLPKKTGVVVCQEIRRANLSVPIIIISVLSDTSKKVDLFNAGADDYMIKPYSFLELMARIRALLRRPQNLEGDVLEIDTLILDTKLQSVRRADEGIYLTRKEYMLLEYLMRNRGCVLSRSMIMEHVWDMLMDPFSNTIESHMVSLRKKIDRPGHLKLIYTIPGRGYKVDISLY
jgi:DNA-binding response OmpR family regulator